MQSITAEPELQAGVSAREQLRSNLELQQLLTTLPDRVKYPVMVPFGSVAFFPGNLVHTNECLVDLGEDAR